MTKYPYDLITSQVSDMFVKAGCSDNDSMLVAGVLVAAELRGIPSHGVMRVKDYYELWKGGRLNFNPSPMVVHERQSTAVIDGDNGMGMVSGDKAMRLAIKKAGETGSGWVAVRNSNHYGIAGYYSMMALDHDMIGISMTNANPLVAPTLSVSRLLGTNPLAVAIPAGEEPPFVADFATTPVARGKLAMMERRGEQAPTGYIQDADGNPSRDPAEITRGGAIVPLGSDYLHGSHKGYCLSAVIDILSAVLSGANFGPFVPPQVSYIKPDPASPGKGLGHLFGALRIDAFREADEFKKMMDLWIRTFRGAIPAMGETRVYIPGDIERENEIRNKSEGLIIHPSVLNDVQKICKELDVPFVLG